MLKYIFLVSLFFMATGTVVAQHCPWDADIILVVDITTENKDNTIPNHEVELLDSLGNEVITSIWDGEKWVDDRSFLWQNAKETTDFDIWHTNPRKFHFWFAKDNYILFCNYKIAKNNYQLRVRDIDGELNGGPFRTTVVEINKEDFYPLCTNFSSWDKGEKYGFVPGYKPVKVILTEK